MNVHIDTRTLVLFVFIFILKIGYETIKFILLKLNEKQCVAWQRFSKWQDTLTIEETLSLINDYGAAYSFEHIIKKSWYECEHIAGFSLITSQTAYYRNGRAYTMLEYAHEIENQHLINIIEDIVRKQSKH